ncbi:MAG TPA: LysR family transcriptional regulator [Candidatus Binatia bacterium]|jgi:DNA-binding transcriptional LysR family regulator
MTLYQLEVFTLVAKVQSFTKAARELHVGQPSISALIIQLQKELGLKLFEKFGLKSHLTEAGKRFLQRTEKILKLVEESRDEMEQFKGLKKGKISIGSSGMGASLILQAVEKFKERYPEIDMSLTFQQSEALHQKLLSGEVDVALLGRHIKSPLIIAKPYRDDEMVFIVPPKHPLAKKPSVPLNLLAQEHFISYETAAPVIEKMEQRFAAKGIAFKPSLEIRLSMGSRDAIKSAVSTGLGISILTKCHILGDVKAGRLKILHVPELKLKRTLYIAFHKNRRESSWVQSFVAFLKAYKNG